MRSYYRPDYRLQQRGYRRSRRRRLAVAVGKRAALAAAAAAVAAAAAFSLYALGPGWVPGRLAAAGLFGVEAVEVRGTSTLPTHVVREAAGIAPGESLLAVDLGAVRARLEALPRVRAAAVARRLPGTLLIEVAERVPLAVVPGQRDLLVDREGEVVEERPAGAGGGLPVITGVETAAGRLTARGRRDLAAGLELLDAIRAVGFPALAAIERIDVGSPEDALIVPLTGRPLVRVGRGAARERLARWRLVAPDMASRWPELEYVDLRSDGQVVALPAAPEPEAEAGERPAAPRKGPSRPGASRPGAGRRPERGGDHA